MKHHSCCVVVCVQEGAGNPPLPGTRVVGTSLLQNVGLALPSLDGCLVGWLCASCGCVGPHMCCMHARSTCSLSEPVLVLLLCPQHAGLPASTQGHPLEGMPLCVWLWHDHVV